MASAFRIQAQDVHRRAYVLLTTRGYVYTHRGAWERTVPEREAATELAWLDANAPGCQRVAIAIPEAAPESDPDVIATGTGERKPRPTREQLLAAIPALEDQMRGLVAREDWIGNALAHAQISLAPKYGMGDGSIFGRLEQPLGEWSTRQLENWHGYLVARELAEAVGRR